MAHLSRISRLRDCGIFRDFSWPADLPDFGRYNLIYGWNGSGKTTLSRMMRCLEKRTVPAGQVTLVLDGREIKHDAFQLEAQPIRVFNREFVAENVFPVGGGELPPIYVLGEENVEKQKIVERLKGDFVTSKSKLESARSAKKEADRKFDQFCIEHAGRIRETLRSSGKNPYNNYDKSDFKSEIEKLSVSGDWTAHRLEEVEREKLLTQHRAVPKPKLQEVSYAFPVIEIIVSNLSKIMMTTIVSAAIEALKGDHDLAKWSREGLKLHLDRKADRCLFCEQSLPKDRLASLEKHFNDEYEQFMRRLDKTIGDLQLFFNAAADLRLPNKAELYDDLSAEYQTSESALRKAVDAVRSFLNNAVQALEKKKQHLFEPIKLDLKTPSVDINAVQALNTVVRKHNQTCDDFENRVSAARERLALDMLAADWEDFVRLRNAKKQAEADEQAALKEVEYLASEIKRLEREIVEHRQPAEELNSDLHSYLGHDELQLEVKDTGYTITRHGEPPLTLSEGEMTAIALLYFLKSLQDRRFDFAKGIIVLDDPVSSLDANALYLAFGFIRERVQDAGQVFIFTHNFTFFRQVRNWFRHMKGQKKEDINKRPSRFFMLDCACGENGRCATIQRLDPLLENYESEYHYLFSRVYRAAAETAATGLEQNYVLPNMARRMLEAFLAFRQPEVSGELWQKMQAVRFDEAKKLRILRFLHTHSHSNDIGEPEHDLSVLAEGPTVLKDLMEMIGSLDPEHFSAMEKIMAPPSD